VRRRRRIENFAGEDLRAGRVEDMDAESAGQQLLQVFRRNEILILRVLANEIGDVRAERDNTQMIDAGEIERKAGKFCCQAMAFEWRRNFGVDKNDTAGKAAIRA